MPLVVSQGYNQKPVKMENIHLDTFSSFSMRDAQKMFFLSFSNSDNEFIADGVLDEDNDKFIELDLSILKLCILNHLTLLSTLLTTGQELLRKM